MGAAKTVFGTLIVLTFVLVMFLVAELRFLNRRLDQLEAALPGKSELAMLRPLGIRRVLDDNCSSCHTDRRFAETYGEPRSALRDMVERMRTLPGGEVVKDVPRAVAALVLVRCTICHDEAVTGQIALMAPDARQRYLVSKLMRIRPVFRLDERDELVHAFRTLVEGPEEEPVPTPADPGKPTPPPGKTAALATGTAAAAVAHKR